MMSLRNANGLFFAALATSGLAACSQPSDKDKGYRAEAVQFVVLEDAWSRCFDKVNDGTDGPVMECIGEGQPAYEGLLEQILAERQRRSSSSDRTKLRIEQSHWREQAQRECDSEPGFVENDGLNQYPGTAAAIDHDLCEIEAARRRAATLIVREFRQK